MSELVSEAMSASDRNAIQTGSRLKAHHRIVLLTEGHSTPFLAKTAISMLRYRQKDVVAVLDSTELGKSTKELFGSGNSPVVDSINGLNPDALYIGIAPPGGNFPERWRVIVGEALRRGIDVVSGLHDFLSEDEEFARIARENDCCLIDVRRNCERQTAKRAQFREGCLRIHTVGHDCSVGKMVVALEVHRELSRRNVNSQFVATGQTGIMISGEGVPIDCVVSDFVNGATESLVKRNENHDVLLVEGQGCISHPSFSAVTLGLLHGCAPDGLIYCYEVGRKLVKGLQNVPLVPNRTLIDTYESIATLRHPCRVIGIAMNSRNVSAEEAAAERSRINEEFGLPVCDVYRDGASSLVDAVIKIQKGSKK